MIFAEIGAKPDDDLFLRLDYDGAIATNGGTSAQARQDFGVLSGTKNSTELMESFLKDAYMRQARHWTAPFALRWMPGAWGRMALGDDGAKEMPSRGANRGA